MRASPGASDAASDQLRNVFNNGSFNTDAVASRNVLVQLSTMPLVPYARPLDGARLLGLLQKHGYNFSINLQDAKRELHEKGWL
jgi:hypothetical protein